MRLRAFVLFVLFGSILLIAIAACDLGPAGEPSSDGRVVLEIPDTAERATVARIIDGDTIEVVANGINFRVRYIGVDTPEREQPYYEEATEVNRQLVAGQTLFLDKDVSETDRFGRLLRYVYLPDGTFVNAELVRLGYAQMVTFPPDVRFQELFQRLQRQAREAGRGLWGLATPPS